MTNPYRDMCAELVDSLHKHTSMWEGHEIDLVTRARALLQQLSAPVPVSERLPEPSDVAPWPKDSDASAWCWLGREVDGGWEWKQRSAGYLVAFPGDFTHWLPANALPTPETP